MTDDDFFPPYSLRRRDRHSEIVLQQRELASGFPLPPKSGIEPVFKLEVQLMFSALFTGVFVFWFHQGLEGKVPK